MMKQKIQALYPHIPLGMALMLVIVLFADSSVASAAGFSSDIGLKAGDGSFQNNLTTITNGMFTAARIISTIMIALAGLMIVFNVESANKTTWNIILGIGLALNFGTVLMGVYGGYVGAGGDQAAFEYKMHVDADKNSKWYDFLQPFTRTYIDYTKSGAVAIIPVAGKLLIVLTAISASIKVSLDLISGDKMKFLVQTLLETGFYLFLILKWYGHGIDIMGSLCNGFESIGYHAGGYTSADGARGIFHLVSHFFTCDNTLPGGHVHPAPSRRPRTSHGEDRVLHDGDDHHSSDSVRCTSADEVPLREGIRGNVQPCHQSLSHFISRGNVQ